MPPKVRTAVDFRREFVLLATQEGANIRELCRRYQFAPATGYKWIRRYREGGLAALEDRSRRPHTSPARTAPEVEDQVLTVRDAHPTWGARKIWHWLDQHGASAIPSLGTITAILHRHDRIAQDPPPPRPFQRFHRAQPNELWQLDFMGHRPLRCGRVHPLTLLDDHSRFGLLLAACAREPATIVRQHLTAAFRRYGLPDALLCDNGPPWGTSGAGGITALEAWWLRLGIRVCHGRAHHPQTQGKLERWHRTIGADVFGLREPADLAAAQRAFDTFRDEYNTERPHEELNGAVPASRYQASARPFPERLPDLVFDDADVVCRVRQKGEITFQGRRLFVSEGLGGELVGVRATPTDGLFVVRFCQQPIVTIDLRQP